MYRYLVKNVLDGKLLQELSRTKHVS